MHVLLKKTLWITLGVGISLGAQAHRGWIVPASTVLSGSDPWVTFDAAVSNDIFHADHAAMRLESLKVLSPSGKNVELQNAAMGKYRSTFDLNLQEKGTYKIFTANSGLNASWETEDGKRAMWPQRGQPSNPEGFEKEVPKKAKNLKISESSRRMETFVTAGTPSKDALKPTNLGLELQPITHPNDLFAGESADFQFLMDGKPAVGVKVTVIPGGMRYRNGQDAIDVVSDKNGKISIKWPKAGLYWLSASYEDDNAKKPATIRRGGYVATFEVLPQ